MKLLIAIGLAIHLVVDGLPAQAADRFPSRPIVLINPFTPGGPVDAHFRVLSAQAEKVFGVPVVVENRPGATATLGPATMAATAKPDGYTISNLSTGIFSVPAMQKVSFDPVKDFTYIIMLVGYRSKIGVAKDAPWQTWKELVADAKARPDVISYGSSGPGSVGQLGMEAVSQAMGMKLLHVPFRGNSEVVAALIGGHINVGSVAALQLIDNGDVRPLLVFSKKRVSRYPNLPSLTDEGIDTPVDLGFPYGLGGPKGMDPAIMKALHDGFKKASETPENLAIIEQLDNEPRYLSSEDYRAYALKQIEEHRKLVEAIGLARKD